MLQFFQYYGKYQSLRGNLGTMPFLGRLIVTVFALPGLALILAALLVFAVGITALLLLAVPAYRLVQSFRSPARPVTAGGDDRFVDAEVTASSTPAPDIQITPTPRRQIDVRIVE